MMCTTTLLLSPSLCYAKIAEKIDGNNIKEMQVFAGSLPLYHTYSIFVWMFVGRTERSVICRPLVARMEFVQWLDGRTSLMRVLKQGQTDIQSPYIRPL
jgi:hypothetical protein